MKRAHGSPETRACRSTSAKQRSASLALPTRDSSKRLKARQSTDDYRASVISASRACARNWRLTLAPAGAWPAELVGMRSRPWGESWHEHFGRFSATMARFEKAALVSKLRHAPDAKQAVTDRCQGGSRCGSPQRKSSPGAHPKRAGNAVGAPSRPAGTLGPRGRAISRRQLSAVPLFFFGSGLESSYLRVSTIGAPAAPDRAP